MSGNEVMQAGIFNERLKSIFVDGVDGVKGVTDVMFEPDRPLRVRFGSMEWRDVEPERIYDEHEFNTILAGMLSVDGSEPNWHWPDDVKKAGGCLYPCYDNPVTIVELDGDAGTSVDVNYRVRGTIQRQRSGNFGVMLRCLQNIQSLVKLGLPEIEITEMMRRGPGLMLVTGPTGAGKSTTIAGMVDWFNNNRTANIVIFEDPIEYRHEEKRSRIITREIGVDVDSYSEGVAQVLRFVPDVIVLGEIRDAETMRAALRAGESGHFVIAQMHAPNAVGALRKALSYLSTPGEQLAFAGCLQGVLAQGLINSKQGVKLPVFELLDCDQEVAEGRVSVQSALQEAVLGKGEEAFKELSEALGKNMAGGKNSLPYANRLLSLVRDKQVDAKRALAFAPDRFLAKELLRLG